MTSYRDWVVELSNTTGLGSFALAGAPVGTSYFLFRNRFNNGEVRVNYWVTNAARTKWEKHRGCTLTYGTPDTLTRNVVESTSGDAAISWVAGDLPLRIYIAQDSAVMEASISNWLGTSRHPILNFGNWFKQNDAGANLHSWKLYNGNADVQLGVLDSVNHRFVFDPSVVGERALSVQTFTAVQIVEFLDIPTSINHLRLEMEGITGTNDASIHMQSAGADGAWDGGGTDYQFVIAAGKSTAAVGVATGIGLDGYITEAINIAGLYPAQGYSLSMKVANIQAATHTKFVFQSSWCDINNDLIIGSGVVVRREAARIRHLRVYSTLGVQTGKATLFGSV